MQNNEVIIDIETMPIEEMKSNLPDVAPSRTLKDPVKIEADIAKKKAEQIERMALSPVYGQICSFAACYVGEEVVSHTLEDDTTEYDLLELIFTYIHRHNVVVTWNGLGFDIPFIYKRAMLLGLELNDYKAPPLSYWMKRYTTDPHCDLMQVWGNWSDRVSLNDAAFAVLGAKKIDCDFRKFPELIRTAEGRKEIAVYNEYDVTLTMQLYVKMRGFLF